MSTEKGDWRLSWYECRESRLAGVNAAIAAHLGADQSVLNVLTSKNVRNTTHDGVFGFMEVTVEYTEPDGRWHWHSLRFNGEKPVDLSDEHLTLLGRFACERQTETHDYTTSFYGRASQWPEAMILDMPEPAMEPQPTVQVVVAA